MVGDMAQTQTSVRLDEDLLMVIDEIAAANDHERSDEIRTALRTYAHLYAPAGWDESFFATGSSVQAATDEALGAVEALRSRWATRAPADRQTTVQAAQGLARVAGELWLLAREIQPEVAEYAGPASDAARDFEEVIRVLDVLPRRVLQTARTIVLGGE
jgi:predicted transcriptional regulator